MRRNDKHILTGALIGSAASVLTDLFLQWRTLKNNGQKLDWQSYNGARGIKWAATGGLIGAFVGGLVYEFKIEEESKVSFNPQSFLKKILVSESLKSDPHYLNTVLKRRELVLCWLSNAFGHILAGPLEDTSSFNKRTAISSNFDLDITVPFSRFAYQNLEGMYNDVFEKIQNKFSSIAYVTKQTKTIGLTFRNGSDEIHFDIAPGREINNYQKEKALNFYINPHLPWQNGSSIKTNVGLQTNLTVNKPHVRKIIKLIKTYRDRNDLPLPSVIIDQLTVEAFNKSAFDWRYSVYENLIYTLNYIAGKLINNSIIDHANSNNNLLDKMNSYQRSKVSDQIYNDIDKVEQNQRYLKEIFDNS